jgi:hypothetical protein
LGDTIRILAGAVIGVVLVATDSWIHGDGSKSFGQLVDEAISHLESGFASAGGS